MPDAAKLGLDSALVRLPRWMAGVAVAGGLLLLVSGRLQWAAGFSLGALVAILAYGWLHQAVGTALHATDGRTPRGTLLKLAMRYPLLIILVVLFYETGWLPLGSVIAGLFVPLAGALAEGGVFLAGALRGALRDEPRAGASGF